MGYETNGLLSGLANGIKEGLITYQNAQNIQHTQRMQELMAGVTRDADGNMVPTPEAAAHKQAGFINDQQTIASADPNDPHSQRLAAARNIFARAGNTKLTSDPYTGLSANEQDKVDALSKADISGQYGMLGKQAIANVMGERVAVQKEGLDFNKHKTAVAAAGSDGTTQKLLDGYQSMKNALVEFKNNPSPQSFHTLQSVARMNAGSSNRSGVSERADQYATDTGIKKDEIIQMMTGNMQDVNLSSPGMVDAIMKVMNGELTQKQVQASQQVGKKTKGFLSEYDKPSMQKKKVDLNNVIKDQYGQFDLDENGKPIQQEAAPANAHPMDEAAVAWARANPKDPRAPAILKHNGLAQ